MTNTPTNIETARGYQGTIDRLNTLAATAMRIRASYDDAAGYEMAMQLATKVLERNIAYETIAALHDSPAGAVMPTNALTRQHYLGGQAIALWVAAIADRQKGTLWASAAEWQKLHRTVAPDATGVWLHAPGNQNVQLFEVSALTDTATEPEVAPESWDEFLETIDRYAPATTDLARWILNQVSNPGYGDYCADPDLPEPPLAIELSCQFLVRIADAPTWDYGPILDLWTRHIRLTGFEELITHLALPLPDAKAIGDQLKASIHTIQPHTPNPSNEAKEFRAGQDAALETAIRLL